MILKKRLSFLIISTTSFIHEPFDSTTKVLPELLEMKAGVQKVTQFSIINEKKNFLRKRVRQNLPKNL